MAPPATAPPFARQKVGKGRIETRPNKVVVYKTIYFWSYCYKLVTYLRSSPPLKSLERETVTMAVEPSWA